MADDALLSSLCSICTTSKSKYCCPGCSARTCSLPCYKRHQQWAQCSGKRDPTKYVKKSQLATPAGIDHDFNFLTGIERGLERAEKNLEGKGLGTPPDLRPDRQGRRAADHRFAAAGVTVVRAPEGISRQKENKTHRAKKKGNIIWTLEWIRDGKTRILTESTEALPILQLQPFKPSDKRTRKRKRGAEDPSVTGPSTSQDAVTPATVDDGEGEVTIEHREEKSPSPGPLESKLDDAATSASRDGDTTQSHNIGPRASGSDTDASSLKYDFYLLRPRTSSSRRVLIPLEPTATLADCLRGRTVLEFPTIYAFPLSTPPPSEEFVLEEEYLKQERQEQKEFEDLIKTVKPEALRKLSAEDPDGRGSDEIDGNKILDVLKQDIGAGGPAL